MISGPINTCIHMTQEAEWCWLPERYAAHKKQLAGNQTRKDEALLETIFYSEYNYTPWIWKLLYPVAKYHNLEASNELISIHVSLGSQIYEQLVHFAIDKAYDHKYSSLRLDCTRLLFLFRHTSFKVIKFIHCKDCLL